MSSLHISHLRLFSLIRASILGTAVELSLFESMDDREWQSLLDESVEGGVSAICFSALEKLPVKPNIDILMDWMGQSVFVHQNYAKLKKVAADVAALLKQSNVEMMVLKGLSLSEIYPQPENREFGDLDIYAAGYHDLVNGVFVSKGAKIEKDDKHDVISYSGVNVENHKTFISVNSKVGKALNDYLVSVGTREHCSVSEDGWLIPGPTFNAVFLLRHMARHLAWEGMTLKNVIDWGLFLYKEGSEVDWDSVRPLLRRTGMAKAFDVFTAVASEVLAVDLSAYLFKTPSEALVSRVLDEVLSVRLHDEAGLGFFRRLCAKTSRLMATRWVYTTGLLPDKFWSEVVWGSAWAHVKRPRFI